MMLHLQKAPNHISFKLATKNYIKKYFFILKNMHIIVGGTGSGWRGWRRLRGLRGLLGLQMILEELDGLGADVAAQLCDQLIDVSAGLDHHESIGFGYVESWLFGWHSN